jgi:uncharacterized membrane protein
MQPHSAFLVTTLCYACLECTWLSSTWGMYRRNCEDIIGKRLELRAAITVPAIVICYALILVGLYALILRRSDSSSIWRCALFGLCVYGVYNCVSLIMLPGYSVAVAMLDSVWGSIALGIFGLIYVTCLDV